MEFEAAVSGAQIEAGDLLDSVETSVQGAPMDKELRRSGTRIAAMVEIAFKRADQRANRSLKAAARTRMGEVGACRARRPAPPRCGGTE